MKAIVFIMILISGMQVMAQKEVTELTWEDLVVKSYENVYDAELDTEVPTPQFSKKQLKLDSAEVIISGNFHVLNSFDSKTFLLSKDEIIKTPMQRDEVMVLMMEEDPNIYFGRKVKVKGTLIIDKNNEVEPLFYLTNVEKVTK